MRAITDASHHGSHGPSPMPPAVTGPISHGALAGARAGPGAGPPRSLGTTSRRPRRAGPGGGAGRIASRHARPGRGHASAGPGISPPVPASVRCRGAAGEWAIGGPAGRREGGGGEANRGLCVAQRVRQRGRVRRERRAPQPTQPVPFPCRIPPPPPLSRAARTI